MLRSRASIELQIDPHTQYIYELALAQLELRAFGIQCEPNATLRLFRANRLADTERLCRRSAYITAIDRVPTDYAELRQYNQTTSINQYLTHWFYPYKGKFHPQMVRALLNIMQVGPGATVLDPFLGSGTTAVETQLLGASFIGVDISPVCTLVSRVKSESWRVLDQVMAYEKQYEVIARTAAKSKSQPHGSGGEASDEERVRNFFKVAELIAHSDRARRSKPFIESFVNNVTRMERSVTDYVDAIHRLSLTLGAVDIRQGDARALPLEGSTVDAILTSPPYAVTLDYVENDDHALRALGYNPMVIRENFVGVRGNKRNRLDLYLDDMRRSFLEMYRVLRPGRWCVIIIGNGAIGARDFDLRNRTVDLCADAGFEYVRSVEKPIRGRPHDPDAESILMFMKPPTRLV